MNQKGAVPVPYIIALVLAVVVLAVIGYWLFFSSGEFGRSILEASCSTKKLAYCNAWRLNSFDNDNKPSGAIDFSVSCESMTSLNRNSYYAPECCEYITSVASTNCHL